MPTSNRPRFLRPNPDAATIIQGLMETVEAQEKEIAALKKRINQLLMAIEKADEARNAQ